MLWLITPNWSVDAFVCSHWAVEISNRLKMPVPDNKHTSGKIRRQHTEGMTELILIISGFVLQVGNNISIL